MPSEQRSGVWTLYVCPECGDAVSRDAGRWGVPPEFMQFCRHSIYPEGTVTCSDVGRNVKRITVTAVGKYR